MEDEHYICQNFELPGSEDTPGKLRGLLSFYAVYDGHGGQSASRYCRSYLFRNVVTELMKGVKPSDALRNAFLRTDEEFLASEQKDSSGSTVNAVLIHHPTNSLWVANAGDSRCILSSGDQTHALSRDHKASCPDEVERIRRAGGFVLHNRVMGGLAVSRSVGDAEFKSEDMALVIAEPEIEFRVLDRERDEFVVIACDGLWDVMKNEEASYYVRRLLKRSKPCGDVCEAMAEHAVQNLKSLDNVSIILINLWVPSPVAIRMDGLGDSLECGAFTTGEATENQEQKQTTADVTPGVSASNTTGTDE